MTTSLDADYEWTRNETAIVMRLNQALQRGLTTTPPLGAGVDYAQGLREGMVIATANSINVVMGVLADQDYPPVTSMDEAAEMASLWIEAASEGDMKVDPDTGELRNAGQ